MMLTFYGTRFSIASSFKKDQSKILTDIDILLMVKKVLEEEYVTLFTDVKKLITNT